MNISERVENILKVSRDARNSDKELLIIYMQKAGMDLSQKQRNIFRDMPSSETIRRIRQKFQEQGKYKADKAVDEARFNKYRKVRYNIAGSNQVDAEELLEQRGLQFAKSEWPED